MPPSSSIGDATAFVGEVLTGGLAMGLATLALAGIGFAMLTGRVDLRRGAAVVIGCFLMLGAPAIARGILGFGSKALPQPLAVAEPTASANTPPEAKKIQKSADPYAGASLVN